MKTCILSLLAGVLALTCVAVGGENGDVQWKQRFNLNTSGSAGNTESFDMRVGWRARQTTDRCRRLADASYNLGVSEGEAHRSALTSGFRNDWLMPDDVWFAFGEGRYDFDDFRDWRHRVGSHWGLGSEIRKTDTSELLGRIGVGASKQWERSDDIRPEGLLGLELEWEVTETQEFAASSCLYPRLDKVSEYRVVSRAEYNAAIDYNRGVTLVFGLEHEYESYAGRDVEKWDLRYYAGVSIPF